MKSIFEQCEKIVISLDHRVDRRDLFVQNLIDNNFDPEPFKWLSAIEDKEFGGLGCAKSHLLALTEYITKSSLPYCAVFEDDFSFRTEMSELDQVLNILDGKVRWDVFLLAGTELRSFSTPLKQDHHAIEQVFDSVTASGYIVSRSYVKELIFNLLESIEGLEKFRSVNPRALVYHSFALDRTWNRLQRRDQWYCTKPMFGEQTPTHSDIENKFVDYRTYSS